jgi:hypothetical protein
MLSRVAPELASEAIAACIADARLSGQVARVPERPAWFASAGAFVVARLAQQDRRILMWIGPGLNEANVARAQLVDGARVQSRNETERRELSRHPTHGSTTHVEDSQAPYPQSGSRHVVPSSICSCTHPPSTQVLIEQPDRKQSTSHSHSGPPPPPETASPSSDPPHSPPPAPPLPAGDPAGRSMHATWSTHAAIDAITRRNEPFIRCLLPRTIRDNFTRSMLYGIP